MKDIAQKHLTALMPYKDENFACKFNLREDLQYAVKPQNFR